MNKIMRYVLLSLVLLGSFSCNNTIAPNSIEPNSLKNIKPTVVHLSIDENVEIKGKEVEVSVYGYNPWMADVDADLIHKQQLEISKLPTKIELNIPENARAKVRHLSEGDQPNYYLHFEWDSNGDGKNPFKGDLYPKEIAPKIQLYGVSEMKMKVLK